MDPLWISAAFLFGFAVKQAGLPPLVGFLLAGFVLNALGIEGGPMLESIADMGVMLLLFSIGLKLRLKSFIQKEVWAGAGLHMAVTILLFGAAAYGLATVSLPFFQPLNVKLSLMVASANEVSI